MKKYLVLISIILLIIVFARYAYGSWVNENNTKNISSTSVNKKSGAKLPDTVDFIKVSPIGSGKIKINWEPPQGSGIMALIYRDTSVIYSQDRLTTQNFITQVDSAMAEYIDAVKKDGTYYYAIITAKDNITNKILLEDQNYSSIPIKVEVPKIPGIVSNIQVALSEDKKSAVIKWKGDSSADVYKIYRANRIIDNEEALNNAEIISSVEKGVEEFKDTFITNNGKYYYAITTINEVGENTKLVPDENYTTNPLVVPQKEIKKKELPKQPDIVKVESKPKLKPKPKPIKKLTPKSKKIVKKGKVKKRRVVRKKRKKRINYYAKVQTIIRKEYYGENYDKCLSELRKIIYSKADSKSKNIARLFLAKTYYKLGKYKKALSFFAKLQDIYPDESKFWINLIANKSK